MGNCTYCGKPAGLFKSVHPECETADKVAKEQAATARDRAIAGIAKLIGTALKVSADPEWFSDNAKGLAAQGRLTQVEFSGAVTRGLHSLLDRALEDHFLSQQELSRISDICDVFAVTEEQRTETGLQERLVKTVILQDLNEGKAKSRVHVSGPLSLVMRKDETLLWVFRDVAYHEIRTRTEYVGKSAGVSVRVAKGVYVRLGANKGERIESPELKHVDSGLLAITDKNLFFKGSVKGAKIPHRTIMSIKTYSDGIEIMKEGANPKPQIYLVDDPWFAANLLTKLS
jgi:hypothetical protein